MRRLLIILLAALATLTAAAQHDNTIYIEDFEMAPDSTVTVNVTLANGEPTGGFQFRMSLPAGLQVEDIELTRHSKKHKMYLASNQVNDSTWMVVVYPMGQDVLPTDSVAVLRLTLTAAQQFNGGIIAITRAMGASQESTTIYYDDSTANVTLP